MGLTIKEVILISLLAYVYSLDRHSTQIAGKITILYGALAGLILGDFKQGLEIGATLQLMSLGVANLGGASMPDYPTAAIISATIAITSGKGMAAGMAIGLPVGMLGMNFDVLIKLINSAIAKRAQNFAHKKQFGKMTRTIPLATIIYPLESTIPVFIAIVFGKSVVQAILNFMPQWFTVGLNVAGGMLPAVGFAMLLVYMPLKKYGYWLIVGFVATAYLKMPVLGVALLGAAAAIHLYLSLSSKNKVMANTSNNVGNLSEEDMEDE
ncbi:PTS Man IIC [Lactobacillus helsingborgensis]|uniref:PTS sugar transporter subunit IIC n=1 Tax=Lactobacillus helsingborgensis TaxID=1218494 RepID=A0AA47GHA9_9LACO|nr:PTS sugar transporter subunit IIC [Lactobacillus helsingborgensis]KJY65420.1 PTS Man IIC [Lactobacillus helsingborgensis]UZX30144.1 PTS sugar transporter subunit IIC [Lactobacillus helsingborgensis]